MIVVENLRKLTLDAAQIARKTSRRGDFETYIASAPFAGSVSAHSPLRDRAGLAENELFESPELLIAKYFGKQGEGVIAEDRGRSQGVSRGGGSASRGGRVRTSRREGVAALASAGWVGRWDVDPAQHEPRELPPSDYFRHRDEFPRMARIGRLENRHKPWKLSGLRHSFLGGIRICN